MGGGGAEGGRSPGEQGARGVREVEVQHGRNCEKLRKILQHCIIFCNRKGRTKKKTNQIKKARTTTKGEGTHLCPELNAGIV